MTRVLSGVPMFGSYHVFRGAWGVRLPLFPGPCGDSLWPMRDQLGPYRILDLLGNGGMGSVYRARHDGLRRVVALKIVHEKYLAEADVAGTGRELNRRF